uniref:Segment polarity protein dishevelled (inferred by orthology to a D. melanogaster protein) n=1 Tax=Anisakis simplex TaxID=6269 RepID=A0A0M3J1D9_ANISI
LDDNTPYLSVIPVADDVITLGDFKKVFTRKGYKYFCKQLDRAIGCEVKVEIRDDSCKLEKSANGLIELVLLSTNTPSGTLPRNVPRKHLTAPSAAAAAAVPSAGGIDDVRQQIMDSNARKRRSLHEMVNNGLIHLDPAAIADHRGESVRNCTEDSITAKRAGEGLAELYTSNSEDPYRLEESNSRFTFNSEACSSSAYGGIPVPGAAAASGILGSAPGPSGTNVFAKPHRQRRPRKERYRKAYVPSTISSITESRWVIKS